MRGDLGRQRAQYQRGLILGLTVAELMLLILFALLLALGGILLKKEAEILSSRRQAAALEEKLRLSQAKVEVLGAMVANQPTDQFFQELVNAREAEQAAARETADLQRREQVLEEQNQLAKAVGGSADSQKTVRDFAALGARLEAAVRQHLPNEDTHQTYNLVPQAVATIEAAKAAGLSSADAQKAFQASEKGNRQAADYRGQIARYRHELASVGKGGDYPPCWVTEAGKIEFLFDIDLLSDGQVRVRDTTPPDRLADRRELVIPPTLFAGPKAPPSFLALTESLLSYEKAHDCRFFVTIGDQTGPTQKSMFKSLLLTVESRFYKQLKRSI